MQVELYRTPLPTPDPTAEAAQLHREAQITAATEARLHGVVAAIKNQYARTQIPYPRLTPFELAVWRTYLPTSYASLLPLHPADCSSCGTRALGHYRFDTPPLDVLQIIADEDRQHRFYLLEIRTPERASRPEDPILLGHLGQDVYLLARWGESLLPFSAIVRKTWLTRLAENAGLRDALPRDHVELGVATAFTLALFAASIIMLGYGVAYLFGL